MSAAEVRDVLNAYAEVLARGDYARFFAGDIHFEVVGTDQIADGAVATEQAIRFLHEIAFDARPELNVVADEHGAAAEAVFAGTRPDAVRVPSGLLRRRRRRDHGAAHLHVARIPGHATHRPVARRDDGVTRKRHPCRSASCPRADTAGSGCIR